MSSERSRALRGSLEGGGRSGKKELRTEGHEEVALPVGSRTKPAPGSLAGLRESQALRVGKGFGVCSVDPRPAMPASCRVPACSEAPVSLPSRAPATHTRSEVRYCRASSLLGLFLRAVCNLEQISFTLNHHFLPCKMETMTMMMM